MATILSFLKKYRVAAISAICMMLIELSVELIQPILISKIIDDGIAHDNISVVWLWGGVLALSALLAFGAGVASSFFASHASQGFGYDLRDKLYAKVESFTHAVFNKFQASSLITRLTGDITQLQEMVFMSLRFATRVPLLVTGSMIMALVVNFKLGLMLVVTVPLLVWFVTWMLKKTSAKFREVQAGMDTVNGVIQENLTGMRLIRIFVRMGHETERFKRRSGELMQGTVSALRLTETTMPLLLLVMNASVIAILWFGRIDIVSGNASTGEVVAVLNYSFRTIGALSALSWIMSSYSRAAASGLRVIEVLETEDPQSTNSVGHADSERLGEVEYKNVHFRYPDGDISVLEDISFKVLPKQRVAIMGATGSGKSSLVGLLPRLYEATEGVIQIDGVDITKIEYEQLREAIGYVPQEVILFSGTVKDNIAWGVPEAGMEQIIQAARQAQIHETIESLPKGYETMLGQRGVNLSGGQKQRLSIARALIRKPAILVLDDSTSALDVRTEAALLQALTDLECTTFIITQKISSTTSADVILLLDEGRLIAKGTHEELMASSELYQKIYESQHGEGILHVQDIR
ncbi:ATP-binding cassette subfamily B protein [Fontibacillus solani]|uniref:ATP-binding cassette subfamily B protein n=1 Tax=Fontibacillus solani TaxID=1572857 RepID=A0A7W3SNZ3_9BACL|nr:ABC transporter ATP-binding protein [Fontibacillus solani]MBA9083563.1 ATP-binding cassette subfamily B protein [Fontibacillus solani]